MKKVISMIALAAISFGSVYAHAASVTPAKHVMQTDTTMKKKKKMKKPKKDTTATVNKMQK